MLWDSARSHLTAAASRALLVSDPFFQQLASLASSQAAFSSSRAKPKRKAQVGRRRQQPPEDGEPSGDDGGEPPGDGGPSGDDGVEPSDNDGDNTDEGAPDVLLSDVEEEMIEANVDALPDPSPVEDVPQPPPAGEPAPPTPTATTAEDARGYVTLASSGRVLGRITTWGSSISARCNIHANCTRPYSFRQLPSTDVLRQWLLDGITCTTTAVHMGLTKRMRTLPPHLSRLHEYC